jgi:hypothetical protein
MPVPLRRKYFTFLLGGVRRMQTPLVNIYAVGWISISGVQPCRRVLIIADMLKDQSLFIEFKYHASDNAVYSPDAMHGKEILPPECRIPCVCIQGGLNILGDDLRYLSRIDLVNVYNSHNFFLSVWGRWWITAPCDLLGVADYNLKIAVVFSVDGHDFQQIQLIVSESGTFFVFILPEAPVGVPDQAVFRVGVGVGVVPEADRLERSGNLRKLF